jgi:hypothetical protein
MVFVATRYWIDPPSGLGLCNVFAIGPVEMGALDISLRLACNTTPQQQIVLHSQAR